MDHCFVFTLFGAVWLAAFAVYLAGCCNRIYLRIKELLKLGIMEEKEFNKMILAELRRIAGEVYNDMIIKDGIYTSAELANNKDFAGNCINWELYNLKGKQYTVNIGTFSCSFKAEQVFCFVWKFETLCRIKKECRIKFRFGNSNEIPINEKAMYLNKSGKVVTKKKKLIKYSDIVAVDAKHKEHVYFYSCGIWYYIARISSGKDYILNLITEDNLKRELGEWNFNLQNPHTQLYKALRDSIETKSEIQTKNLPAVYVASHSEQIEFIETLSVVIVELSDMLIKQEINRTLKRLEMLYKAANIVPEPIVSDTVCEEPSDKQQGTNEALFKPGGPISNFDRIYTHYKRVQFKRKGILLASANNRILNGIIKPNIFRYETIVLPTPGLDKRLSGSGKRFQKPNAIRIRDGTR